MHPDKEDIVALACFHDRLGQAVELGYGADECDDAILGMFETLVRRVTSCDVRRHLSFTLPVHLPEGQNTCANLLELVTSTLDIVQVKTMAPTPTRAVPPRSPVVFPFVTTLGISGGVFLLASKIAQLAPALF